MENKENKIKQIKTKQKVYLAWAWVQPLVKQMMIVRNKIK